MLVEKRTWREIREAGWSETLYSGLYVKIAGREVLVTKLSHGLRTIVIRNPSQYKFGSETEIVEISYEYFHAIGVALEADESFQKWEFEHQSVV